MGGTFDNPFCGGEIGPCLLCIWQWKRLVADYAIEFCTLAAESSWKSACHQGLCEELKDELGPHDPSSSREDLFKQFLSWLDKWLWECCRCWEAEHPKGLGPASLSLKPLHPIQILQTQVFSPCNWDTPAYLTGSWRRTLKKASVCTVVGQDICAKTVLSSWEKRRNFIDAALARSLSNLLFSWSICCSYRVLMPMWICQ